MGGYISSTPTSSDSSKTDTSPQKYVPPPRPPTPPKELTDKPWREDTLEFSEEEKELKEQMDREYTAHKVRSTNIKRANLLLLGLIRAGKTSFLNSVATICKGRIAKILKTGDADKSLTTQHGTYAPKKGFMENFRLMDCMGLEREGVGFNVDDVCNLVMGHVPRNYTFNPDSPLKETDPQYIRNPKESDKVHCVVIVIDAEALYGNIPDTVKKRIKELKARLDKFEIQQIVLLTKIDKLCTKVNEDIANVFKSVKVQQMVDRANEVFGLPRNQIFPVKNYSEETKINFKLNIPILLALKMMLNVAEDFIENQEDEKDEEENNED